MPLAFDARHLSTERRESLAWQAHERLDVPFPTLRWWNYDPCAKHRDGWIDVEYDPDSGRETRTQKTGPDPSCRACAIIPMRHQRVGALWLYLKKKALLADVMGAGKSAQAGAVLCMMAETGELSFTRENGGKGRALLVPRATALPQWRRELLRMMPNLQIVTADGSLSRAQRNELYLEPWQVLLMGPEMFRSDYEVVSKMPLSILITDDIDGLRNPETTTSIRLDNLGRRLDRYIIMSGTPLQKRLMEMHAVLDGIGGEAVLGTRKTFELTHVVKEGGRVVRHRNLDVVKRSMAPLVLRRTSKDFDTDARMPRIMPQDVLLDLYPRQRAKYEELREGVIRLLKDGDVKQKRVTAMSKLHYGASICAGLGSLGGDFEDGPGQSVKLDWLMDNVSDGGDLGDEKVVVFARLKNTLIDIQMRLREQGIGFATVWGDEHRPAMRQAAQERFWEDDKCRIMLGTSAIEQSLNFQVARHLVNVDMIMNQARMHQLAGRIARLGSGHTHVFVHNLLTTETQEERYLPLLEREAALAGFMWDETSDLFQQLDPDAMLRLISG